MVEQLAAINVHDLEPDNPLVLGVIDFTSDRFKLSASNKNFLVVSIFREVCYGK